MPKADADLNAVIGSVLKGEYTKRGMTVEGLAADTKIPYSTLRKKIAGESPIFATELLVIVGAISPDLDPGEILDEAQRIWEGMSAAAATKDDLRKMREKQEQAREMPPEALEDQERRAATTDEELSSDEPDAP
jgi:predicted transcriptional regulator